MQSAGVTRLHADDALRNGSNSTRPASALASGNAVFIVPRSIADARRQSQHSDLLNTKNRLDHTVNALHTVSELHQLSTHEASGWTIQSAADR